jgi:hypothetical protein
MQDCVRRRAELSVPRPPLGRDSVSAKGMFATPIVIYDGCLVMVEIVILVARGRWQ